MNEDVQTTQGKASWWAWLPVAGFAACAFWSGQLWAGAAFALALALGLVANVRSAKVWLRRPWFAYAMNWSAPAFLTWCCVNRTLEKDYWGVAVFAVIWGFAMVNAIYLEPSPRRALLYRALRWILVLVSFAAILAYLTTWH